jgi:hypothetical protein
MIAHLAAALSRQVIAYAILVSERFKMIVDASGGLFRAQIPPPSRTNGWPTAHARSPKVKGNNR